MSTVSDPPSSSQPRKHRKINRTLPQLKRNAACVPCRRRRVKCDGARPLCSSCIRSFQFLARTQPDPARDSLGAQCYYDDEEARDPEEKLTMHQLEAKVAELQSALLLAENRQDTPPVPERLDAEAGQLGGPFADVFWPGWPRQLPTPTMMDHLVFTFFNSLPSVSRLIHRETFLTRLALPPVHPDFPHPALLHAICAVAARYSAAVKVSSVQDLVAGLSEEAAEQCFSERHWKHFQDELRYNCSSEKLLEILQAQVVVIQYCCQTAKWLEGWTLVGSMTRLAIALGIFNEMEPGISILDQPKSDREREARRALASEIIAIDAAFSASGSWPGTLPRSDEMHFHLPASKLDFMQKTAIAENPQTLHSSDLFKSHPVEDSFVMYTKGSFLLARAAKFARQFRTGPKRQSNDFNHLDRELSDFSSTFPTSLRDPLQPCPGYTSRIDTDLINAHIVHRVAAIMLHETFADVGNPDCASASRILVEAKACLGLLYLVMSTTTDMALMLYPITSVWFYHAARILVLFYHRALEMRDQITAHTLLKEVEVFQMAFAAMGNRFAMGAIHCGMIDAMIRRIHEEFGLPEQEWSSPRDWTSSSVLNYQAGMRIKRTQLPLLPLTHPEGLAWGEKGRSLSYRQIFDQQRGWAKVKSIH